MGEHIGGNDPAAGPDTGGTASNHDGSAIVRECLPAVLAHPRRRHVLEVVTEVGLATTRDLAIRIAAREQDVCASAVTEEQRREVTVSLYHVHLPKLADVGVLEIKRGVDRIRPGPNAGPVADAIQELSSELDTGNQQVSPDA